MFIIFLPWLFAVRRRRVLGELLRLSCWSLLRHWRPRQPQWSVRGWFLLPFWLFFNHSICLPLSQSMFIYTHFQSYCLFLFAVKLPTHAQKLMPHCLLWTSWPLLFSSENRATFVQRDLPCHCLVLQESTSQIWVRRTASLVDLDFSVRRP